MSRLYISNGSGYQNVADGDKVRYSNGSTYAVASEARYCNGSTYVPFWSRSSPLVASFYPTLTTNLRWSGSGVQYDGPGTAADNTRADLFIGRYGGSYPYHYTSFMQFRGPSREGHGTMNQIFANRPAIKWANLRLYRVAGGWYSPVGYLRIGAWTQPFAETQPATTLNGTWHNWNPHTANDVAGWMHGQNRDFPVWPDIIFQMLLGSSLMISEVTGGYTSSGGTSGAYSRIVGLTSGDGNILPLLTVGFDIV